MNITPDSFYDGGRFLDCDSAFRQALRLSAEGADLLDVGGESSRPGSRQITVQEEIDRICPVIEKIKREIDIVISVDTCKPQVADEALKTGASIINDISGLGSREMRSVALKHDAGVVIMHMKGTPGTMQEHPRYDDLVGEIRGFLMERTRTAVEEGIRPEKIIIDPGIGFGKTLAHNYEIIRNLDRFADTGFPLLIGLSRKSLIGNISPGEDRLPATIALNSIAVMKGAGIIRVHDVKEHVLAVRAVENAIRAQRYNGIVA